jgi:hypothetical protein
LLQDQVDATANFDGIEVTEVTRFAVGGVGEWGGGKQGKSQAKADVLHNSLPLMVGQMAFVDVAAAGLA